ncbi:MAG: Rid family detoxifying hydrolase [Methanomassiliicoccales archaeon]|nr:Rid family detoxifying hydrolase [Methanomassiliicoccales archaeon]
MKEVRTPKAPEPIGPYSQALVQGELIFCSGQLGLDPVSGSLPPSAPEQARQALLNLEAILEEAGSSLSKVLKVTIYLIDLSSWADVNRVYSEHFTPPYPARTAVQVSALPKDACVEIDIIAAR